MKNLPQPKTQLQEVFYELLTKEKISVAQMMYDTGILNIKAKLLNLRRIGVDIETERVSVRNKYGRKARFGQWKIPAEAREKAIETYLKITKDEK